ncbi:MAG: branched-chain amino acid transport system substrate-binding protein, partial [Kiritimatiellia bacterium]
RIRVELQLLADGGDVQSTPREPSPDLRQQLETAIADKDADRARSLASKLAQDAEPGSDAAVIASYVDRRLAASDVRSESIGVLLPLTGKYKGAGAQIKAALELGYNHNQGRRRLVVVDAGADSASCITALESLVLEQGVVAVVGPLRSDIAPNVTQVAHALGVPLLGLHKAVGTTEGRPWVIEGIATPQAEVEALVNYVMHERKMTTFAVFAPDSAYGHRATEAFEVQVAANGGTITVSKFYDPKSMDVIASAKELGRKDYEARAQEYRDIKEAIEEAGGDPRRSVLPPVIDFDAIFVPDNYRRIPVAVGGLAYEEFPVGQFRVVKDGPTIPLLGLSGWNHPNLITSGGPYVRDSIFTDVFVPSASAAFVESYSDKANREPNTLEAQTYSVGQVLAAAANSQARTRSEFRQALLDAHTEVTATGAIGVQEDSQRISHTVKMLSVNKDEIFLIPPTTPEPEQPEAPAP